MEDYSEEERAFFMEQLMDNYKNPQNVGELEDYTFLRHQKNASCGDTFDLYVKIENNKICDVKYKGDGCAISTASFSMFSQELIGMNIVDARKLTEKDIYKIIGIKISPARVNCALLSLNAFRKGIEESESI